jgi:uncharacterized phage-associated protein
MIPISALQVADYFLALQDEDAGDLISNMKLQKLLYYAQGLHLAMTGEPLFSERITAWQYGPVVSSVYHEFKKYGSARIPPPDDLDFSSYDEATIGFLNEVYQVYGQFSAWKLRNMTHEERPYQEAKHNIGVISHNSMREHFQHHIEA